MTERLRAALEYIANRQEAWAHDGPCGCTDLAREALEGEDKPHFRYNWKTGEAELVTIESVIKNVTPLTSPFQEIFLRSIDPGDAMYQRVRARWK